MNDKNIIKEKKIDFFEIVKKFWNPEPEEKKQEEEILSSAAVTELEKKELLKTLKGAEKLQSELFKDSYKVDKLRKRNYKQDAEQALKNKSGGMENKIQNNNGTKENGKEIEF